MFECVFFNKFYASIYFEINHTYVTFNAALMWSLKERSSFKKKCIKEKNYKLYAYQIFNEKQQQKNPRAKSP